MQVYSRALDRNPAYQAAQSTFKAEQQGITQSRALLLPNISASASYASSDEKVTSQQQTQTSNISDTETSNEDLSLTPITFDAQNSSVFSDEDTTTGTISLSQTLFDRDQWLNYKKSFSQVELAQLSLDEDKTALLEDVGNAYLNVLETEELIRINESELDEVKNHHELTNQRYQDGLGNLSDVLESESRVHIVQSNILDSQTKNYQANQFIERLVDEQIDEFLLFSDDYSPTSISPSELGYWLTEAEKVSHSLQSSLKKVDIAAIDIRQRSAGHWPTLSLKGSYNAEDIDNNTDLSATETNTYAIGVFLDVPLFSGGSIRSKVIEAKHRYLASEHNSREAELALAQNVRNAHQETINNYQKMQVLNTAYRISESALDLRKEGFLEGLSSNLDLLDAYRDVFSAKRRWRSSIYGYLRAVISLKAYLVDDLENYLISLDAILLKGERE